MIDTLDRQSLICHLEKREGNIFEQAIAMQLLCKNFHYTQASLAKRLGISQSCVGNKIRLLQFSAHEQAQILEFGLTERHARVLLRAQPPKREKLIATVGNMHLTVQQTEELVEKYTVTNLPPAVQSGCMPAHVNADHFLLQTQNYADKLRSVGYKTTCLTESGEGWCRITVTIVE